ncbi:MAG: glycosyltransferase family 1 protein, partial [Bacteroidota bacterium]
ACNAANKVFTSFSESEKENVKQQYTQGADYFFYTGAIHPRKNVDQLIKAFDLFKAQTGASAKLLIAGRMAWQVSAVEEAYNRAKYKEDIQLLGYVAQEALTGLMASAKCFCYLSRHEGFGIPLLEAMQSEVPIICSNVSSLPEVAGDAALLVAPGDVAGTAAAMQQMWKDESLQQHLIKKGRRRLQHYSWERAATVVDALLRSV